MRCYAWSCQRDAGWPRRTYSSSTMCFEMVVRRFANRMGSMVVIAIPADPCRGSLDPNFGRRGRQLSKHPGSRNPRVSLSIATAHSGGQEDLGGKAQCCVIGAIGALILPPRLNTQDDGNRCSRSISINYTCSNEPICWARPVSLRHSSISLERPNERRVQRASSNCQNLSNMQADC